MLLWPARIVTPRATYEPANMRAELGSYAEVVTKAGEVTERIESPEITLIAEGDATGSPMITQRWRIVGPDGEHWLAEVERSCGCGATRVTGTNLPELVW